MADGQLDGAEGRPSIADRDASERARAESEGSAADATAHDRFSTDEVFARIIDAADEEITRGSRELYSRGVATGFRSRSPSCCSPR
jgi:hypothetical protein